MTAKVLVVDDSGLARRRARAILEDAGYEVLEATDGMSALERYFVAKPDIVSADVQTSSHDLSTAAGAVGFLVKPLDADEILRLIRSTLSEVR